MGRTNPKLVPFLEQNLEKKCLMNLQYEDSDVFWIELPRFDKDKCANFEKILKAWYDFNGKLHKYLNYSNGKSVFQAALKKSVYLMQLPSIGKRLRFRFATVHEVKENKRRLKEKAKKVDLQPLSPLNPPSVSSGYMSGSDIEGENIQADDTQMQDVSGNNILMNSENGFGDMLMQDVSLNNILINSESGFGNSDDLNDLCDVLDEFFGDIDTGSSEEKAPVQNIQLDAFNASENMSQFIRPVTELKTTPVSAPGSAKKYWLCTEKVKVKATLMLICELQVIENEGTAEGSVVIPNDVFEPGVSYELKKTFELNDILYFFFSPSNM